MKLSKDEESEVIALLSSMSLSPLGLGTQIISIATLIKVVYRTVEICGEEFQTGIGHIVQIERMLDELVDQTETGHLLAKYLATNVPSDVAPVGGRLLPHRKSGLKRLTTSSVELAGVRETLTSAFEAYRNTIESVQPKIGKRSTKLSLKWTCLEKKLHHTDIAAAFVDRLLLKHDVKFKNQKGAKILCYLDYPTEHNPWTHSTQASKQWYSRVTQGEKFLAYINT